jgi:cell volume regulation protein A
VTVLSPILDTLSIGEPNATAVLLLVFGLLVAFSALFSRTVDRIGIPVVLLFLVLGMLGGSEGVGGLAFDDYGLAARIGTIALALILFDGGLNTSMSSIRAVLLPSGILATFGVALTAGLLAVFARLLGFDWTTALLLGAVVSSTDAAAVFAVLRGGRLQLQQRVGRTIEVESCVNDPMAVILTLALIQVFTADPGPWWQIALAVPAQLAIGAGVGVGFGLLGQLLLQRVRMQTVGLYPALTLALAFLSFGIATLAWGSGFLAVFTTGLVLGGAKIPYRNGLARIHDAIAWFSQVSMFLMLGLLVFPSQLLPIVWEGLGIALFLALVARPVAVVLCLLPFRWPVREVVYVSWIGLRGAVPIILATFPVLAGVPGALDVFNVVFFIVVVSSLIPGATIRPVTRALRLTVPDRPSPSAVLEINSTYALSGELASFLIDPSVAVCGAQLREITFPEGSAIVLLLRDRELIAARGTTRLDPGDHAFVYFRPQDRGTIELLFGHPEDG